MTRIAISTTLLALAISGSALAQQASRDSVPLSLQEAVNRALTSSEEIRLARSQVDLAVTQARVARSEAYPQLAAQLGYTKTFASAFAGGGGGFALPDSLRFEPDSTLPLADRVKYLEENAPTAALGGLGALFGNLPFGQANAYNGAITASQTLFSGGRLGAGLRIAKEFQSAAELQLEEQTADIELQVRSAYYRARLAQDLVGISQAAVAQAQRFLASEKVRFESGLGSELDVLRAEVSLANLQPSLINATNAADVATLDLKRLIDLPLDQTVKLSTGLDVPAMLAAVDTAAGTIALSRRAAIAAEERQVRIREEQVKIARARYWPTANLVVNYGRQIFPSSAFALNTSDLRTDFTAALAVSVPIFNGNRTAAEVAQANVALNQERLRLAQLKENIQVEYERARGERERARASIQARQRTVDQAQRVYDLTVLRYEQGLASQLEVSDSRLSLLQARSNLAQAVSDFQIADATLSRALGITTSPR
jgi:outer membrane protein